MLRASVVNSPHNERPNMEGENDFLEGLLASYGFETNQQKQPVAFEFDVNGTLVGVSMVEANQQQQPPASELPAQNSKSDQFQCDQCDKTFTRKTGLIGHKDTAHHPEMFDCTWCKKACRGFTGMKRHVKRCRANPSSKQQQQPSTPI